MIASPSMCHADAPRISSVGGEGRKNQPADLPPRLRVLVAYEDEYRSYRETIGAAIRTLRPHTEVVNAALTELEMMAPHADLVICSRSNVQHTEGTLAWIELPNDPERPAKISLQGRCSEVTNLTLDGLLAVVDTVEDLLLA
jgi:hypothetical protein